jgi:XTP/dITP diphosphohydrolase
MAHKLLLATRNQGKIEEFRRILDAVAPGEIDLVGLNQFPDLHDVIEGARNVYRNRNPCNRR